MALTLLARAHLLYGAAFKKNFAVAVNFKENLCRGKSESNKAFPLFSEFVDDS